ncbi:transcriptional regulator [Gordoniibacillus kamchatkensis]|uniref:Thiamine-phosphate synthase n=1 Tax=Gordoniibacillus kamchatkensis TaxID=1590651 RepID=A0ABR5AJV4_9BACL|nr:thiazole tautomerase TenI [Paenibacillus sp. VKM B-2647]KIL41311.1 transcriptional regulator [Paenibacillus sp. VKM B-2647]
MDTKELHVISTGRQPFADLAAAMRDIHRFVSCFHLREKTKTAAELMAAIELLQAAGMPAERIVVNDRADVAAAAGASGVHLAYHSLSVSAVKRLFPQLRVGKSVHSEEEAVQAEAEGADYVMYGHIFPTSSKPGLPARGIEALRLLAARVRIPVVAIGGIKPPDAGAVLNAGAAGVAVMSGILEADDPGRAAAAYYDALYREV